MYRERFRSLDKVRFHIKSRNVLDEVKRLLPDVNGPLTAFTFSILVQQSRCDR